MDYVKSDLYKQSLRTHDLKRRITEAQEILTVQTSKNKEIAQTLDLLKKKNKSELISKAWDL